MLVWMSARLSPTARMITNERCGKEQCRQSGMTPAHRIPEHETSITSMNAVVHRAWPSEGSRRSVGTVPIHRQSMAGTVVSNHLCRDARKKLIRTCDITNPNDHSCEQTVATDTETRAIVCPSKST